jgi:hypothetical protein
LKTNHLPSAQKRRRFSGKRFQMLGQYCQMAAASRQDPTVKGFQSYANLTEGKIYCVLCRHPILPPLQSLQSQHAV